MPYLMHLSMYSPITPPWAQVGLYSGGFNRKPLPHPGAFDILLTNKNNVVPNSDNMYNRYTFI